MDELTVKDDNVTAKDNEKFRIHLNIAERKIPFRIKRENEERIRKAANLIDDKVKSYRQKYAGRDAQDALSVAILDFVVKLLDVMENNDLQTMQLKELEVEIDDYLQLHEQK